METNGVHFLVVRWGKVLGEVVSVVRFARASGYLTLALLDSVAEPVKLHVN
jgi:hypothetical protein